MSEYVLEIDIIIHISGIPLAIVKGPPTTIRL